MMLSWLGHLVLAAKSIIFGWFFPYTWLEEKHIYIDDDTACVVVTAILFNYNIQIV